MYVENSEENTKRNFKIDVTDTLKGREKSIINCPTKASEARK